MSGKILLTIDGREFEAASGQTILEVARENGIHIPTLCYYEGTTNVGACRVCVVEVENARSLVASRCMPVSPGMVVKTNTERVLYARRMIVEFEKVRTTCTYCGVGCQIYLNVHNGKIIKVTGNREYGQPNDRSLCVKGRFGMDFVSYPDRLRTPLIRKEGKLEETGWDEAYCFITQKFASIKEKYGADSVAGLSSARCTNEENYLFQKFMRAVIGTNNLDHCARL